VNFWMVVGGCPKRAIVCEERALGWVRDEMEKESAHGVEAFPAECHWTAQILFPREGGDMETGWEA